jgi:hypothetical protein
MPKKDVSDLESRHMLVVYSLYLWSLYVCCKQEDRTENTIKEGSVLVLPKGLLMEHTIMEENTTEVDDKL